MWIEPPPAVYKGLATRSRHNLKIADTHPFLQIMDIHNLLNP